MVAGIHQSEGDRGDVGMDLEYICCCAAKGPSDQLTCLPLYFTYFPGMLHGT